MRTKKLNVFEEQRKWMRWHTAARASLTINDKGEVLAATYISPLVQWRGLIAPDGTVNVPDMDYYNSLTSPEEMSQALDEMGL